MKMIVLIKVVLSSRSNNKLQINSVIHIPSLLNYNKHLISNNNNNNNYNNSNNNNNNSRIKIIIAPI